MLKSPEQKSRKPFVCSELSKLPFVRDMQPVSPKSQEYQFQVTDGFGFDKWKANVYLLHGDKGQYILSCVLTDLQELFSSQFMRDKCFKHGIDYRVVDNKTVLTSKLKQQGSNVMTFMKLYDLLVSIKTLADFRETIKDVQSNREKV